MKHTINDTEEAHIQSLIAADPESPEATDEQLARARPFSEALPALAVSARRGRPPLDSAKTLISLRIDADIIAAYRAMGAGWQARINAALRKTLS